MLAIHLKMNKELNYNHDISTLNGVGPKIKNTLNSIGLNIGLEFLVKSPKLKV